MGYLKIAKYLLDNGADVNLPSMPEKTPLGQWVEGSEFPKTPLYYAARKGYFEMVELLLEHGANVMINSCCFIPSFPSMVTEMQSVFWST